jgi:hypothetical protein
MSDKPVLIFIIRDEGKKLSPGRGKVHEDWLSVLAWRFSYAMLSMARQKTVSQDTYGREQNLRF